MTLENTTEASRSLLLELGFNKVEGVNGQQNDIRKEVRERNSSEKDY